MTGKRQRRLRRLVNRAARAWSHASPIGRVAASKWRKHLGRIVSIGPAQARNFEHFAVLDS